MILRSAINSGYLCTLAIGLLATPAAAGQDWTVTFGGAGFDSVQEVVRASNGGYLAAGNTSSMDPLGDLWVARVGDGGE